MVDFLAQGGLLMIPIGICSVLALAFSIERVWFLWQAHIPVTNFWDKLNPLLEEGSFSEAREQTRQFNGILARVVRQGLSVNPLTGDRAAEEMEAFGLEQVPRMERFLPALNFIARISPLLGLLGTVAGMIQTFSVIAEAGVGNPELLAGGIYKALITTASGLAVGITTLFFHHLISRRVDHITHEMEMGLRRVRESIETVSKNGDA